MNPRPHRRLTDPKWLLNYAAANPRQALIYGFVGVGVILTVTASISVEAVPLWVGALVAGFALTTIARESLQRARLLWAASKQATDAVTDGVVAVSGQTVATDDRRLRSKYSDNKCLAYESTETERVHDGQGTTTSTQVTQNILPFYVNDGSGPVLVDATTGTLTLKSDQTGTDSSKKQSEGVITEGDQITVYGEVKQIQTENRSDEDDLSEPEPVITTGRKYGDVIVTDRSGRRVLAGQVGYALGWVGVGVTLVIIAVALATGIITL